jgi:hypothetical protein
MRKALAQNPNLLRTLIGMGLTLILLLAYAVYGATIESEVYVYNAESNESTVDLNLTGSGLSAGSTISISNEEGFYSHPDLGDSDAEDFSCSEYCSKSIEHTVNSSDGYASIISLTDPDPALRGKGSIYADSQDEAEDKSSKIISTDFESSAIRITVIENGNRSVSPSISLTQVNEELTSVEQFEVDAATEFMWALAAVIGCFSMVLVPSFTVYFAARAKQKKLEVKLNLQRIDLEEE